MWTCRDISEGWRCGECGSESNTVAEMHHAQWHREELDLQVLKEVAAKVSKFVDEAWEKNR